MQFKVYPEMCVMCYFDNAVNELPQLQHFLVSQLGSCNSSDLSLQLPACSITGLHIPARHLFIATLNGRLPLSPVATALPNMVAISYIQLHLN